MKKETVYKIAILILILLNVLQVVGRFWTPRTSGDPRERVVKHLKLDKTQEEAFFGLVKEHRAKMRMLKQKQRKLTEQYFAETDEALLEKIAEVEKHKIIYTEKHFSDIKKILKTEQYESFEAFKKNALARILRFQRRHKRHKR